MGFLMNLNVDEIITWIGGSAGAAFLLRFGITALKKQGLADATLDSHAQALANKQKEAEMWEARYKEAQKEHESNLILIGELRVQNKMLRMLLIHHGLTAEAIDKALEVNDGAV